jgi:hypothetical protein
MRRSDSASGTPQFQAQDFAKFSEMFHQLALRIEAIRTPEKWAAKAHGVTRAC